MRTHKCTGNVESGQNKQQQQAIRAHTVGDAIIDDTTINDADLQCSQSLDEFISESCNRMGLVDQSDTKSPQYNETAENLFEKSSSKPQTMTDGTVQCDPINLNDLPSFCSFELANTSDLTDVMPSMNEIFPQTLDLMNALYANDTIDDGHIQHLYADSQAHTNE